MESERKKKPPQSHAHPRIHKKYAGFSEAKFTIGWKSISLVRGLIDSNCAISSVTLQLLDKKNSKDNEEKSSNRNCDRLFDERTSVWWA